MKRPWVYMSSPSRSPLPPPSPPAPSRSSQSTRSERLSHALGCIFNVFISCEKRVFKAFVLMARTFCPYVSICPILSFQKCWTKVFSFICVCVCVHVCTPVCVWDNRPPKGMNFCLDFLTALFPVSRIMAYCQSPWCWKRLRAGGEGNNRGWDGWMASLTWWTWIWANSGKWWRTGKPGVLQSMGCKELDTT